VHGNSDVTIPAAQFVLALQSIVARNVSAQDVAVLSVGHVAGGMQSAPNVMPKTVSVGGTGRFFRSEIGDLLCRRIEENARALAQAAGCEVEMKIARNTPPLVNSKEAFDAALSAAITTFGEEAVNPQRSPSTGGEDFSFFGTDRPGAYFWMGAGPGPDGKVHDVHTDRFDFNDDTLGLGVSYWVNLVNQELGYASR
jgi:metal-dependent amidase/aminoacylase/carboxypeptidase family protein